MNALRQLLTTSLVAVLAGLSATAAPTNFWFAPNGTGDGTTREKARAYSADFVQWQILHGSGGRSHDVAINFLPGEYLVDPFNTTTTEPSDWRIRILGHGKNPEDVVLKLKDNYPAGASERGGNWVNVIDLARNNEYIDRLELENLTVDGNWAGQTAYNHAGYFRGYKNSPIAVSARTGRIRRVLVRNYGSHGLMPQRTNDHGAGVEVFPISIETRDEGQAPEDGDPRPWVVEDSEVSDFHTVYNGYTTALISVARLNVPRTPSWAWDDTQRRLVWFRRNQVRGPSGGLGIIALGAAGLGTNYTGKITWSDNVVLNATVFNTDTGAMRHMDITNCLGLDIYMVGHVGTHSTKFPFMMDYDVSGNAFRFGWVLTAPSYRDFYLTNTPNGTLLIAPDPSPRLGRYAGSHATGLGFQGIAEKVRYSGNWFTSRSKEDFGNLNPLLPQEPSFRVLHRMLARDPEVTNSPFIFRADPLEVEALANRISSVPFDFEKMKPLDGGRFAKLSERSSPLLERREALPATSGFNPLGGVQRVELAFTNVQRRISWRGIQAGSSNTPPREGAFEGTDRVLIGAVEVVCGKPSARTADGVVRLPVRVALQPTPSAGLTGTQPLARRRVYLEVLPGSLNARKLSAETGADGIAQFSWPVAADANGTDHVRVWTDGGNGRPGEWDEYQDAWATADLEHGCTIAMLIETDVADVDHGHSGLIRLRRSGPDDRTLTVKLEQIPGPNAATPGVDFRLTAPAKRGYPGGRDGDRSVVQSTVEFARGQKELTLQVDPIRETARSGKVVALRVTAGEGYGPGQPATSEVAVYSTRK